MMKVWGERCGCGCWCRSTRSSCHHTNYNVLFLNSMHEKYLDVQVAVSSAAQLFSPALWGKETTSTDTIYTDQNKPLTGHLRIPEYQRPYRWGAQQIEALLQDLHEHKQNNQNQPNLHYYLGSLILHQKDDELNIIDGQQRITTLALLASQIKQKENQISALLKGLEFSHEISQKQIRHNLKMIQERQDSWQELIDLERLQFTLVITRSEDDAYRFFETQNSGGVRLGGPDIIKAHHLRAIAKHSDQRSHLKNFALRWERMGKLDEVIDALLKARYWQAINMRELPSHRQTTAVRDCIVSELAQQTGTAAQDIAYGRSQRQTGLAGEIQQSFAQQGYEMRQPLNAGINTVRYLAYFQDLQKRYLPHFQARKGREPDESNLLHLPDYLDFVRVVATLQGCDYLHGLYQACLLLYISQFGEQQLEQAARKLFRVVYSRRLSNQKAVRETSVPAFVREYPVLDWIAISYTPQQCFVLLDAFELKVDPSNLDANSVKRRFVDAVVELFDIQPNTTLQGQAFADDFGKKLNRAVMTDSK